MPVSRIDRAFRVPENRRCGMNNQGCNRVVHLNAIELHATTLVDAGAPGILARDTVELVDPLCAQVVARRSAFEFDAASTGLHATASPVANAHNIEGDMALGSHDQSKALGNNQPI